MSIDFLWLTGSDLPNEDAADAAAAAAHATLAQSGGIEHFTRLSGAHRSFWFLISKMHTKQVAQGGKCRQ